MICLIRPPAVESFRVATTSVTLPLGLAYIAGALQKRDIAFDVIDAVAEAPTGKTRYYKGFLIGSRLEDIAGRIAPECTIVGISVIFTHEWPAVVQLIKLIRNLRPDMHIIVGGEHCTSMPEFCLASSGADVVAMGEGEETIIELVDAFEGRAPIAEIQGIAYRNGDDVVVNSRRPRISAVDDIAPPAWKRFDVAIYNHHRMVGGMDVAATTIPILATRGCPYQCTYCSSPNMWLPRWIPRDPVMVVDEIEYYIDTFGARNFPFQDLTAIIQKPWVVTFCNEILDRGLDITWQFPSGTRCEAVDDDVAELMRRTGMVSMSYAPESGSERTRKLIKKKMKTENLVSSVKSAIKTDLNVAIFIVIGFPHETRREMGENIPFVKLMKTLGVTDVVVNFYTALPGTEIFNSLYDAGQINFDRQYFAHILHGSQLTPAVSHNSRFSKLELIYWKFRIFFAFYRTSRDAKLSGRTGSIGRAVTGLSKKAHKSKLQTAFRIAAKTGLASLGVRFSARWISKRDEAALFKNWDALYRTIRAQKQDLGVTSQTSDKTDDIHLANAIPVLRRDHQSSRVIQLTPERNSV